MKYMVLECHPGYAVVLDEAGNFRNVANRHYEVGQMVEEVTEMQTPHRKKRRGWIATLAAVAACLAMVVGLTLPGMLQPYASVYVKINPEIRIDVDRQDMVVGLAGINQDGAALIEGYDYDGKKLDTVTDQLVEKAIRMGYLQTDGQITIGLDSRDQSWVENHSQSISNHLQTQLQERFVITVQIRLYHHGSGWDDDGIYLDPENPNRVIIVPDWDEMDGENDAVPGAGWHHGWED